MSEPKEIGLYGKENIIQDLVKKLSDFEIKLREIEKKYHDLLKHLPVGVYHTTPEGKLTEVNQGLANLLGYKKKSELKNLNVKNLYADKKDREKHLKKINNSVLPFSDLKLKKKDGGTIWGRDYPRAVLGLNGKIKYYAGILVDITAQKKSEEEVQKALKKMEDAKKERIKVIKALETLSLMDDLTGLFNRRGFLASAQEQLKHAKKRKNRLYLVFIDIDDLKSINDSWGHIKGDQVLSMFSQIIKASMRKSDIKGRIGGDEFAVLLQRAPKSGVNILISRLNKNLKKFNLQKEFPFELSASIGIAEFIPHDPCTLDELMVRADKKMYKNKKKKQKE